MSTTSAGVGSRRPSAGAGTGEDPLYRGRRLLRRGFLRLNQRQWTRLELILSVGDPSGQLTSSMVAHELLLLYARSYDLATPAGTCGASSTAAPARTSPNPSA